MGVIGRASLALLALAAAAVAVKVKVVMHSEQEDSKVDEEEQPRTELWAEHEHEHEHEHGKKEPTVLPFLKHARNKNRDEKDFDKEERDEKTTTEKQTRQVHPNEMIFPLIYRQNHINSMFKLGENWYTWATERRTDGSKATNYFICYDEPKHCDDVGWERTDALPKCAFQIDSLLPEDRACINPFGTEPHSSGGVCDGGEQMKVSDMVRACGPRIRSLWRFFRIGRRPANAAKPADVNSLICEDEEECYISIEYRIHHDRITFSLHEPTRGQTFKSALKRDAAEDEGHQAPVTTERTRKVKKRLDEDPKASVKTFRPHTRSKVAEGKGIEKGSEAVSYRRSKKNKIKISDLSEDISE